MNHISPRGGLGHRIKRRRSRHPYPCTAALLLTAATLSGCLSATSVATTVGTSTGATSAGNAGNSTQTSGNNDTDEAVDGKKRYYGVWKIKTAGAEPACKVNLLDQNAGVGPKGEHIAVVTGCPSNLQAIGNWRAVDGNGVTLHPRGRSNTIARISVKEDAVLEGEIEKGKAPITLERPSDGNTPANEG